MGCNSSKNAEEGVWDEKMFSAGDVQSQHRLCDVSNGGEKYEEGVVKHMDTAETLSCVEEVDSKRIEGNEEEETIQCARTIDDRTTIPTDEEDKNNSTVSNQEATEEEKERQHVKEDAAEEEARVKAEQEAAEEEARVKAEQEAAEEEARVKAEQEATEEEARVKAEQEAAEEEARVKAKQEAVDEVSGASVNSQFTKQSSGRRVGAGIAARLEKIEASKLEKSVSASAVNTTDYRKSDMGNKYHRSATTEVGALSSNDELKVVDEKERPKTSGKISGGLAKRMSTLHGSQMVMPGMKLPPKLLGKATKVENPTPTLDIKKMDGDAATGEITNATMNRASPQKKKRPGRPRAAFEVADDISAQPLTEAISRNPDS